MVFSVDSEQKTVTYLPHHTRGSRAQSVTVGLHQVVKVSKLPDVTPKGKGVNWLKPEELQTIMTQWNFLPFAADVLDEKKLLDHVDLEVGCLETLWRVLPPCTLAVPVQLPPMLLHKADRGQAMLNHAAFVEQLRAYADRARCLLCPQRLAAQTGNFGQRGTVFSVNKTVKIIIIIGGCLLPSFLDNSGKFLNFLEIYQNVSEMSRHF